MESNLVGYGASGDQMGEQLIRSVLTVDLENSPKEASSPSKTARGQLSLDLLLPPYPSLFTTPLLRATPLR